MIEMETIQLLGSSGKDKVTGFSGVVTSVSFDLYGCICVALAPEVKDGKLGDSHWFDVQRVEYASDDRVMAVPKFASVAREPKKYTHGPADKPSPR